MTALLGAIAAVMLAVKISAQWFSLLIAIIVLSMGLVTLLTARRQIRYNTGGILAIADLYPEDGSFHGPEVKVHLGFDPDKLITKLETLGFSHGEYSTCFVVKRPTGVEYPVFLLTVRKK